MRYELGKNICITETSPEGEGAEELSLTLANVRFVVHLREQPNRVSVEERADRLRVTASHAKLTAATALIRPDSSIRRS